jgi:serine/threonine protein kinase
LIEEYASEGDLHSLLGNEGSLPQSSARFVIAEIAAGLEAVHIHGFAFGDLKVNSHLVLSFNQCFINSVI